MKTKKSKFLLMFGVGLLALNMFTTKVDATSDDEIVNFKDENLKSAILEDAGNDYDINKDGELSIEEMKKIDNLGYLAGKGITDLTGLEYAINVEYIDLSNFEIEEGAELNNITDISPLKNLTKLTFLQLNGNGIEDISALSDLTNLENLYLPHNKIKDIKPLEKLVNLRNLSLAYNEIENISSLKELTKLEYLSLCNNHISDFTPINNLKITDLDIENQTVKENVVQSVIKEEIKTGIKLDTNTSVVPKDTELYVKEITDGAVYNSIKSTIANVNKFIAFDISLKSNNKEIQPNGNVKISIPIPDGFDTSKLVVYRVSDNGEKTEYKVSLDGKYATFETDHFSTYALVERKDEDTYSTNQQPAITNKMEKDDTPKTGTVDKSNYIIAVAIISIVGIIALRKIK